jgi:diacylglycerol kinase (ATP)
MKKNKIFSLKERSKSFKYAFDGVKTFFREEHNARIHLAATIAVIGLSFIFPVSRMEAIALTFAAGFVWIAEIFNTAIEKMADFISTEKSPAIKTIKDLSAAAVLIAALIAVITACFIFIPKFLEYV